MLPRGRVIRFIRFQLQLWRYCARRLRENNVAAMSAALSFQTIFTLVPVLALTFLMLKSLGALENGKRSLRQVLEASGLSQIVAVQEGESPATQPDATATAPAGKLINVADEIETAVTRIESKLTFERIGPIGAILLIWTALGLLTNMERSLNRVFEAPRSRALARRLLLYWSVLTLLPVAFVAATYLAQTTAVRFQHVPVLSWVFAGAGLFGSFIIGVLGLAAVYSWLPNTHLRYDAALGGAIVAVPLWLLAKWGFSLYVHNLVAKGNVYGVLGLIPLFLLWLNYSWLIFLFGAQLAHTAGSAAKLSETEQDRGMVTGPSDVLATVVAVARPFHAGQGLADAAQIAAAVGLSARRVGELLERLTAARLICSTQADGAPRYALTRPADKLLVQEILDVGDPRATVSHAADATVAGALHAVQAQARPALARLTLADLLRAPPDARC